MNSIAGDYTGYLRKLPDFITGGHQTMANRIRNVA